MSDFDAFWGWCVAAYGYEDVAALCLELQDTHGQCVPLILAGFGLHGAFDDDVLEALNDTARSWHETAIAPLRVIRRRLKNPVSDMDDGLREALRQNIKTMELEAEKSLLRDLYELSQPLENKNNSKSMPPLERAVRLCKGWNGQVPRTLLMTLNERLIKGGFLE